MNRRKRHTGWLRKNFKKCHYCGRTCAKKGEMTADHKQPISKGGYDKRKNIVPCCVDCNREKGSLTYKEYMEILNKKHCD